MRAIQSTTLIHKAIQIDVRVCNVVKSSSKSTGLNNACPDCQGDLSKPNLCRSCDKEVDYQNIQKKFKFTQDDVRILTTEELEQLKGIGSHIKVKGSIDKEQFKPSLIVGSYYILPQNKLKKKSEQEQLKQNLIDYAILRESILNSENLFTVKFSLRDKEKIGVLTVENDYIVLLNLAYPEYVQEVDEETALKLDETQKKLSKRFTQSIKPIELSSLTDTFKETLQRILEGKEKPQEKKVQTSDMWGSV